MVLIWRDFCFLIPAGKSWLKQAKFQVTFRAVRKEVFYVGNLGVNVFSAYEDFCAPGNFLSAPLFFLRLLEGDQDSALGTR